MSDLHAVLHDYLGVRRALGYKLVVAERLLGQFIDFLDASGATVITTELAVRWATLPSGASPGWLGQRLSVVRCFAIFAQTIEKETQVPPTDLLAGRPRRAVPYIYSDVEITAIMAASRRLPSRHLTPHTYETLVGLLATTGMFSGGAAVRGTSNGDLWAGRRSVNHETTCATVVVHARRTSGEYGNRGEQSAQGAEALGASHERV
jgi:integrase/recombinase XerD